MIEYQSPQQPAMQPPVSLASRVVFGIIAVVFTGVFTIMTFAALQVLVQEGHQMERSLATRAMMLGLALLCGFITWVCGVIAWSYFFPTSRSIEAEADSKDSMESL